MSDYAGVVANELRLSERAVAAALRLLLEGNTVPFVARYRKEATGSLDEVALRRIEVRHGELEALAKRRSRSGSWRSPTAATRAARPRRSSTRPGRSPTSRRRWPRSATWPPR